PRTDPYGPNSGIRLVWEFLCQGCITPFLSRVVTPFFCSTRAARILPSRPHIAVAVARSGGQGRRLYGSFFVKGASRHFCRALLLHSFVRPAPRAFSPPFRSLPSPSLAAAFKHTACMGVSLSRVHHAIFVAR